MTTARQLRFRGDAREKVLRGATTLADAVRGTRGPKAKCVLIERRWGRPLVLGDGRTRISAVVPSIRPSRAEEGDYATFIQR